MLPEPAQTALRVGTLTGRLLNKWRKHNEVHNLNRELKKALHADHRVPAADRKSLTQQVDKWLWDPTLLGGLQSYVEDADIAPLPAIRTRLTELLKLSDPAAAPAVAEVVVEIIETHVTRAKRTDRRAAYHQTRVSEQRLAERIDHTHASLSEQNRSLAEHGIEHSRKLDEVLGLLRGTGDRGSAGFVSTPHDDVGGGPEQYLNELESEDPQAAARLRGAWNEEGASLVDLLDDPQSWLQSASPSVWETTGRLLTDSGHFNHAEQAFLLAAERGHRDPIRQLVRGSSVAAIAGDESRAKELLTRAQALEGAAEHPAVALRTIEALTDDPDEMLRRLDAVNPTSRREQAQVENLRAQAHLINENHDAALAACERALKLDAKNPGAFELRGLARLLPQREGFGAGQQPDRVALREALADFIQARDLARQARRFRESGQMAARIAEAHFLADDPAATSAALRFPNVLDDEREGAAKPLAHLALMLGQTDLVAELLDASDERDDARVFRLAAIARGADAVEAVTAVDGLRELMDSADTAVGQYAALSLLLAAGRHREVEWDKRAAEMLEDSPAEMLPLLRADYHRARGDFQSAENELLGLGDDPGAVHALVTLAMAQEDWPTARLRAEALLRLEDTGRNRLLSAEVLRGGGEREAAVAELDKIARDARNSPALRGAAYQRAIEIAGERRDWAGMERLAADWRKLLPEDLQAGWFHALALARLARHAEGLALWQDDLLTVSTRDQALLLGEILFRVADSTVAVREISALSAQFDRSDERLEFLVLMAALRRDEPLPPDLEERVREGFESFPQKFPNSQMLWMEPAPTTPEEFDALAGKYAPEGEDLSAELYEKIVSGEGPVASLAAAASNDIASIWCRLPFWPLGYSDETLDELERGDAAQTIGTPAVWDPTSLLVVSALDAPTGALVRTALLGPASVISNSTLEDADHAAIEAAGERAGEMGYDRESERRYLVECDPDRVARDQARAGFALALARELGTAFDAEPGSEERWAQLLTGEEALRPQIATWASTMSVAHRRRLPVFSDDRFIRMAARREGIPTFGTIALLDALTDRGMLTEEERLIARRQLLHDGAWGLRSTATELTDAAREAAWHESRELEMALNDGSVWNNDTINAWYRMADVLAACFDDAPDALEEWVCRTLDAVRLARPGVPAGQHVHSLLVSCWDFFKHPPKHSDQFFHRVLRIVNHLPLRLRPWPPVDIPLRTMGTILEIATEIGDEARSAIFWRMWRRLPALDQGRVLLVLVGRMPPQTDQGTGSVERATKHRRVKHHRKPKRRR
jgi:hypothetical protein